MSIQLFSLRPYLDKNNKVDVTDNWEKVSISKIENVFSKASEIVEKEFKESERHNLFYTVAYCKQGTRDFVSQEVIPFDIDDILVEEKENYLPEIQNALGVPLSKCVVVFSGNGIQILVKCKEFKSVEFFRQHKASYKLWCDRIDSALKESGLPGKTDTSVFGPARLLRLPYTLNKKPTKSFEQNIIKECTLFNANLEDCGFELDAQEVAPPSEATYVCDKEAVIAGCEFLKHAYDNRTTLSEPEWFAALGITAFFNDHQEYSHTISKDYAGYSYEETQKKIENILANATGPRTCENISGLFNCSECKFYNKCKTPLQIRSNTKILTEESGFTTINSKGHYVRHYEDLLAAFQRDTKFVHLDEIERVITFNGRFYETISRHKIKEYAQKSFTTPVKEHECSEFLNLVKRTNCTPVSFISKPNTKNLFNLRNGVFNLITNKLTPHSEKYNFQYVLDYDYDPEAGCPTWEELLQNLTLNRQHLIDALEEYIAFCLAGGSYAPENILILSGEGNNGKTTFINIVKMLVGEKNCSYYSMSSLGKDSNAAGLEGKLVNFCEEEPPKVFNETGFLKKLSGGSAIQVAQKYEKSYTLYPTSKIIMTYNKVPFLKDTSKGMLRRLFIIPFDLDLEKNPNKKIKNLLEKIKQEKSGIFNRLIKAYARFMERGFVFHNLEESAFHVEQMLYDSDSVYAWWKDFVVMTNNEENKVTNNELFAHYQENMEIGKETQKMSMRGFVKRIKEIAAKKNIPYHVFREKDGAVRGFRSLRLSGKSNSSY